MKYKIIELPEMVGKTLEEVKTFVEKEYSGKLAKEEDREDFIKGNPISPSMTWYFFFGSLFRNSDGYWSVPFAFWGGSYWYRYAYWLGFYWNAFSRVVLLEDSEKPLVVNKFCKKCGSRLGDVECNYYNEYTGEKVHDLVCSNEKCERNCDFFGHSYKNCSWFGYSAKCQKCGYTPRDF